MYGFHKKVGLSDNSMRASEKKNKSPSEYTHPYFKRNRPNLLWLIQKPKTASSKAGKTARASRQDESEDENEDVFDVDSPTAATFGRTENTHALRANNQPLMLGAPGNVGQVSEELLLNVQDQLRQVQATQRSIAMMMKKIMSDHDNITQKASMFQGLHEKHESSINAILSFLASVYSKSLDGNQTANIANMFANAIPQNSQSPSGVVDMGDYGGQQQSHFDQPSHPTRKPPLLLQAPGFDAQQTSRVSAATPSDSNFPRPGSGYAVSATQQQHQQPSQQYQQHTSNGRLSTDAHSPNIQEIFDRTPSARSSSSPQPRDTTDVEKSLPETDIMSIINAHNNQNNSNANDFAGGINMDFPEALSHLQGGDTSNPLTPTQQNNVLQLISRNSPGHSNNASDALANRPSPGALDSMDQYNQTRDDLGSLSDAIKEQNQKVESLSQILAPLSPSGSIPGFSLNDTNDPLSLDFDRYIFDNENLDHENYFNGGLDLNGQPNLDLDGNAHMNDEIDFNIPDDLGVSTMQGNDGLGNELAEEGRVVGSVGTSEGTSPANTAGFGEGGGDDGDGQLSPRKRRRRG